MVMRFCRLLNQKAVMLMDRLNPESVFYVSKYPIHLAIAAPNAVQNFTDLWMKKTTMQIGKDNKMLFINWSTWQVAVFNPYYQEIAFNLPLIKTIDSKFYI